MNVKLTWEFNLDLTGKTQTSVNIDDLLFTIYYLLAACDIAFSTIWTLLGHKPRESKDQFHEALYIADN